MYQLAYDTCAGVNFHGGLDGMVLLFFQVPVIFIMHGRLPMEFLLSRLEAKASSLKKR